MMTRRMMGLLLLVEVMRMVVVVRMVVPIAIVAGTRDLRKGGRLREGLYVVVLIPATTTVYTSASTIPFTHTVLRCWMWQTVGIPVSRLIPVGITRQS